MSIDANLARFLLGATDVSFRRTATIGRLGFDLRPRVLRSLLSSRNIVSNSQSTMKQLMDACGGYAEPFLTFLGAEEIWSIDVSSYEGATILHDMNQPIRDDLERRFDVVIDGGSLEHIFNFPVAIKNCMEMVAVGGHFFTATPTNNYPGHGFYQFSPELFFRVLSNKNGFAVERAIVCEAAENGKWFYAVDPARLQRRGFFTNSISTLLLVQARRLQQVPTLQQAPQQSDYEVIWQGRKERSSDTQGWRSSLRRVAASTVRRVDSVVPPLRPLTDLVKRWGRADSRLGGRVFPRAPKI